MHLTNYSINKTAKGFHQPKKAAVKQHAPQQAQQLKPDGDRCIHHNDAVDDAGSDGAEESAQDADDAEASKWSFGQLAGYLQQQGHSWDHVWKQVCRLLTTGACYEDV